MEKLSVDEDGSWALSPGAEGGASDDEVAVAGVSVGRRGLPEVEKRSNWSRLSSREGKICCHSRERK